jgi:hypothetical protein
VVGTPAQRGFSADGYDHPQIHCRAWFGGWPTFPHASLWAEVYSTNTEECPVQFVGYQGGGDPFEPPFFPPGGPGTRVADDINLVVDICEVAAYELAIVGNAGPYEMEIDLRWPDIETIIEGTQTVFVGRGEGSLEVAHIEVPEGLFIALLDQPIWMTWQANRAHTGVPMGTQAQVGYSGPFYAMLNVPGEPPGWQLYMRPDGLPAVVFATIFCRGEPPLGACCAGEQPDVPDAGPLCFDDVPPVNCLEGRWLNGLTCAENWFNPPCGEQACCLPNDNCDHSTRNECLTNCEPNDPPIACTSDGDCPGPRTCGAHQCHDGAAFTGVECNPDAGAAACPPGQTCQLFNPTICTPKCARWNPSSFCGDLDFYCPVFECYDAVGDCFESVPEINCDSDEDCPDGQTCILPDWHICTRRKGCADLRCCDAVCRDDSFCCVVGWDNVCVGLALNLPECAFPDQDLDGVPDSEDNCPHEHNPGQEDCDGDGEGDACEATADARDDDGDGVCNGIDNCPTEANPDQKNKDGDELGDVCDPCPKVPGPCYVPRPTDVKRESPGRG